MGSTNITQTSKTTSKNSFQLILGIIFLASIVLLPSRVPAWFDGLPWNGTEETWVVLAVIPFLLALGKKFLSLRSSIVFLVGILALKTFLYFVAPQGGWVVKAYPKLSQEELFYPTGYCIYFGAVCDAQEPRHMRGKFNLLTSEGWVKTFSTTWNRNASGIFQKPWREKMDFPLDWAIPLTYKKYDELNPIFEIKGTLFVPEGKKFVLVAEGVEEGSLLAKNNNPFITTFSCDKGPYIILVAVDLTASISALVKTLPPAPVKNLSVFSIKSIAAIIVLKLLVVSFPNIFWNICSFFASLK